ncbi:MAG TPA: hypothetical protein V6D22_06825, partial [Candidatus Obscuribacterales bacterium]
MSHQIHRCSRGFLRAYKDKNLKGRHCKLDRASVNLPKKGDKKVILTKAACVVMAALLLVPMFAAQAQAATNYNLTSQTANIQSPVSGHIIVGGHNTPISQGQMITPAELTALNQVLQTGHQSLILSSMGNAIGGKLNITTNLTGGIGNLVIPSGVTALGNVTNRGGTGIDVTGDLTNSGNLFFFSRAGVGPNTAILDTTNLYNNVGGVIETVGKLASVGIVGGIPHLNLNIDALDSIFNSGVITSTGSLIVHAGGQIVNALPAGVGAPAPIIQAWKNVNLSALSGNIANSGTITATTGNVNVLDAMKDINWDGTGGTVSALKGNINLHDVHFKGDGNITLTGGDWLSNNLNINAGTGDIDGSVDNLTGKLNTVGDTAHFLANTPDLVLGHNVIHGDPTFANTGSITISGANTFTEAVTILAGGNITAANTASITDSGAGAAGNVTLIAGGTVTFQNGAVPTTTTINSTTGAGGGGPNINGGTGDVNGVAGTQTATIDLAPTTTNGGNITLNTNANSTVITTTNGGSVVLAAVQNSATTPSGGQVNLGTNAISTTNTVTANGGNGGAVTIIAGANNANAITVGAISTGGTGGAAGVTGSNGGTGGSV